MLAERERVQWCAGSWSTSSIQATVVCSLAPALCMIVCRWWTSSRVLDRTRIACQCVCVCVCAGNEVKDAASCDCGSTLLPYHAKAAQVHERASTL